MQYRLSTLLILLALGPMALAVGYWAADAFIEDPLPPDYYDEADFDYLPPSFKLSRQRPVSADLP
jgi:hypothetical protein